MKLAPFLLALLLIGGTPQDEVKLLWALDVAEAEPVGVAARPLLGVPAAEDRVAVRT